MQSIKTSIALATVGITAGEWVSILADPSMTEKGARVMVEGWNFCNYAGPWMGQKPAPRWADCMVNGTQRITEADNAGYSMSDIEGYTEEKERRLGDKCEHNGASFWTAMLKNGVLDNSLNYCGNWTHMNDTLTSPGSLANTSMNQPVMYHNWSTLTPNGYEGSFYGTWDRAGNLSNSYFETTWKFLPNGTRVFYNTLATSRQYHWLMLYFGVDSTHSLKGGYEWEGRGLMKVSPTDDNVRIRFYFEISHLISSSFYFINVGACWKLNGDQCDGDVHTDITRYALFDITTEPAKCSPASVGACPPFHTFSNGTVVARTDDRFPYDAYAWWCPHDGCDKKSNPCAQEILKIRPHPEWTQYGFPETAEAASKGFYDLNIGPLINRLYFTATTPPKSKVWTTFNIGPEMGLRGGPDSVTWITHSFDVLQQQ
eukprot:TRINITY_DN37517_c0_g1_i1.p1 TRINITY_DN37517_c0_g1~~TRINITY_DN37517_c0_g1_i1.p1  ORF type:complete len:428 (+),score=51.57 TRINITY_DN37517_c0_g1_i1:39-1322(+)